MAYDRDRNDWRGQRGPRSEGRRDFDREDRDDRGFIERAGDEVRAWFGDDEAERRRDPDDFGRGDPTGSRGGQPRGRYADDVGGYGAGGGSASYGSGYAGEPTTTYGGADGDRAPYRGGTWQSTGADRGFGGAGFSGQGGSGAMRHDPRYHQWRERQISQMDREYEDYRREHQQLFDRDFGSWRQQRQTQRLEIGKAREHMEVVGSDGSHVGTVDRQSGDRLILTRSDPDAGGHHHSIPCAWVSKVEDKVELNCTAEQAHQMWREEQERGAIGGGWDEDDKKGQGQGDRGPHILGRSFSGTY